MASKTVSKNARPVVLSWAAEMAPMMDPMMAEPKTVSMMASKKARHLVPSWLGCNDNSQDGTNKGFEDGSSLGEKLGFREGFEDGFEEGPLLGSELAFNNGCPDGARREPFGPRIRSKQPMNTK